MRAMLAEHRLHPSDFIWPLFVCEGRDCEEPIGSLPGVSPLERRPARGQGARSRRPRHSVHRAVPQHARTSCAPSDAREALNADNLICRAIKAIKDAVPEIGVLTDVALDPYTAHGHDGLIDEAGNVINDDTVEDPRRPGAGPGRGRRRHRRPVGHDGRPRRRDPRGARGRRAPECRDHGLCRQICLGLLRPVPRGGRVARAA